MASNPTEADINAVVEFSAHSVNQAQAAQVLKISNNNVELAVNRIIDALDATDGIPGLLKQGDNTWDNTAFDGDRYGQYDNGNTNIPSFNIECVDYPTSNGPSAAPTRPPSRNSQRSMQMSDAPVQSVEQESGVIGNTGTAGVLRPAARDYYDQDSWALVPTTKNTEYIPDAPLKEQLRDSLPGFIKPVVDNHQLPALISILHSIPLARNALLAPERSADSYWRGEDWWKGSASVTSITVDHGAENQTTPDLELLYEVQRLVAFLDSGTRSYASLENLLQLEAWTQDQYQSPEEFNDTDPELKFLLRWGWTYKQHVPTADLNGVLRSTVNIGDKRQDSSVLDIQVNIPDDWFNEPNLYDAIDMELFASETSCALMGRLSNVLILRVTPSKKWTSINLKIPAILYADRYLEENGAAVENKFAQNKKYTDLLATLDAEIERFKYHTPQKVQYSGKMETLTLLKNSMRAFESDTEAMTESREDAAVLAQLQSLYENIERKLSDLEEEKKKAKEALKEIARRFRQPMDPYGPDAEPSDSIIHHKFDHPYELCGAAISRTEYYIRRPSDEPETSDAWYYIGYSHQASEDKASIIRQPKSIDEVLYVLSQNSEKAILVYANRTATSTTPLPLSAELKTFIEKGNECFLLEYAQGIADAQNRLAEDDLDGWGGEGWEIANHAKGDSSYSSDGTLIPRTDDDVHEITPPSPIEMHEMNGGVAVWSGGSHASSLSAEGEPMDGVDEDGDGRKSRAEERGDDDVDMGEAEAPTHKQEVRHIEMVEKKGS